MIITRGHRFKTDNAGVVEFVRIDDCQGEQSVYCWSVDFGQPMNYTREHIGRLGYSIAGDSLVRKDPGLDSAAGRLRRWVVLGGQEKAIDIWGHDQRLMLADQRIAMREFLDRYGKA